MITTIILLSLLGCISMMIQDSSGTILVIAQNRNNAKLAGLMDVTGDFAKFVMYAFSGVLLMTGYGWLGRLFILPILATGYLTTSTVTRWAASRIKDTKEDDQNSKLEELNNRVKELERGQFSQL
jgi:type VI protein secretion system component VasK